METSVVHLECSLMGSRSMMMATVWTSALVGFHSQPITGWLAGRWAAVPTFLTALLPYFRLSIMLRVLMSFGHAWSLEAFPWDIARTCKRWLTAPSPCSFPVCGMLGATDSGVHSDWRVSGDNPPPPIPNVSSLIASIRSDFVKPQVRSLFRTKVNI